MLWRRRRGGLVCTLARRHVPVTVIVEATFDGDGRMRVIRSRLDCGRCEANLFREKRH